MEHETWNMKHETLRAERAFLKMRDFYFEMRAKRFFFKEIRVFILRKISDKIKIKNIETEGATCVSVHILYNVIKELSDDKLIDLSYDKNSKKLYLTSFKSKFTFSCLPKDDFPILTTENYKTSFSLKSDLLKEMIDKTYFAVSNEEARYYLNGILFHTIKLNNKFFLRSIATDGHRLAQCETISPAAANNIFSTIIPKKLIFELRKLIDEVEDEIKIDLSLHIIIMVDHGPLKKVK